MSDFAIRVENLSKKYKIGANQARYQTLRESIMNGISSSIERIKGIKPTEENIFETPPVNINFMACGWDNQNLNRNRYRYRNRCRIAIEGSKMTLGHEKLDVYRLSIGYVTWVYEKAANLKGVHRPARDQWLRASQSIPLNIAEGNGKAGQADRRRYFEIARGSALECAAIQDVLVVGKALGQAESQDRKIELYRIAAMLSRLGGRGYS